MKYDSKISKVPDLRDAVWLLQDALWNYAIAQVIIRVNKRMDSHKWLEIVATNGGN